MTSSPVSSTSCWIVGIRSTVRRSGACSICLKTSATLPRLPEREEAAVKAIRDLIWDAEDDYARTIYKAGVVIGGHLSEKYGAPVLLECLKCPSKFGRRSAIHGLFHVVEWVPAQRNDIVAAIRAAADAESGLSWPTLHLGWPTTSSTKGMITFPSRSSLKSARAWQKRTPEV